jgi:DnaJ family protein A protein 2
MLTELMVRCKKCKGDKVVKDKKRVEFQIEPGTENGERIALKGEGDEIVRPSPHC